VQNEHTAVADRKKLAKRSALAGAVLALLCPFLPHEWRAVCHALASILAL
jgi:hypothetical protein